MARTTPTLPVPPPARPRPPEPSPDPARWRELAGDFARLVAERRDVQSRAAATTAIERTSAIDGAELAVHAPDEFSAMPSERLPAELGGREREAGTSATEKARRTAGERVTAHDASDVRAADVAVSEALAERERRAAEAPEEAGTAAPDGHEEAAPHDVRTPAFDAFGHPVPESAGEHERTPAPPPGTGSRAASGEPDAVTAEVARLLGEWIENGERLGDPDEPGRWRFSIVGDDGRTTDAFVVTRLGSGATTVTVETGHARADAALDDLARRLAALDERVVVELIDRCDPFA